MLAPSQVVVQEVQMVVAAMARVEEAMGMVAAVAMGMVEVVAMGVGVVMEVAAEAAATVVAGIGHSLERRNLRCLRRRNCPLSTGRVRRSSQGWSSRRKHSFRWR